MIFTETKLPGSFMIDLEKREDSRGFFARTFCVEEFGKLGLETEVKQCNLSSNFKKGTLRGMHYQTEPFEEARVVRCQKGSIYDAMVDLRPESPTFKQWFGVKLSVQNHRSVYIPKGMAHGFLTLEDHTEVFYLMFEMFHQETVAGVRFDDPAFGIQWPAPIEVIAEKDTQFELFREQAR